jgi:sugar lactone lactonase YvrE
MADDSSTAPGRVEPRTASARRSLRGFHFTEDPRWHDGALWFSDIHGRCVLRAPIEGNDAVGDPEVVAEITDDRPSGLGWLPDGRLLIVAMHSQRLLRREPDGEIVVHADLSSVARGTLNDMIVAADGTAYVGDMAIPLFTDEPFERAPGQTIRVDPDGTPTLAADDLALPNGHVLTDDGRTLIVAESLGGRVTVFTVQPDRSLADRRTFAEPAAVAGSDRCSPDGICLDAEGAVWVADAMGRRAVRVLEGGEITDVVECEEGVGPYACVLGGADRRTLLLCVAATHDYHVTERELTSGIDMLRVDVPGAGRP